MRNKPKEIKSRDPEPLRYKSYRSGGTKQVKVVLKY